MFSISSWCISMHNRFHFIFVHVHISNVFILSHHIHREFSIRFRTVYKIFFYVSEALNHQTKEVIMLIILVSVSFIIYLTITSFSDFVLSPIKSCSKKTSFIVRCLKMITTFIRMMLKLRGVLTQWCDVCKSCEWSTKRNLPRMVLRNIAL